MTVQHVHGYSEAEHLRLERQATTLADLLWSDTTFHPGETVLEAGCGTGAQTVALARRFPATRFVCVDRSSSSLDAARERIRRGGLENVRLELADLERDAFGPAAFDHIVICFVLEHVPAPERMLTRLRNTLRLGGTLTVVEGDHGSVICSPDTVEARSVIACLVDLQQRCGGNALIGRTLYRLLAAAGYGDVTVSPRMVYADPSRPGWVEGFTRRTFIDMVEGIRDAAVHDGLMTAVEFDRGIEQLRRTAGPDGMFGYTFFKAVARAPRPPGLRR